MFLEKKNELSLYCQRNKFGLTRKQKLPVSLIKISSTPSEGWNLAKWME